MKKLKSEQTAVEIAVKIGVVSIALNALLAIGKLIVGFMLGYNSVTSDGIHGFSDVLTTVIAIFAVKISTRKDDSKYNYGYERYSSIFSVVLAVVLAVVAVSIGVESISAAIEGGLQKVETDSLFWVTLAILLTSIVIKIFMFILTRRGARLAHSDAMLADAWHQLIDALSSIGAIGGLIGGLFGIFFLDSLFSLLIVVMIIKVALDIGLKGVRELTDQAVSSEELDAVKTDLASVISPERIIVIKSRIFAEKYYLELTLKIAEVQTVGQSYREAEMIRTLLKSKHANLKDIHIDYIPS